MHAPGRTAAVQQQPLEGGSHERMCSCGTSLMVVAAHGGVRVGRTAGALVLLLARWEESIGDGHR
eukprot:6464780-Prymnesium_polylepis.3